MAREVNADQPEPTPELTVFEVLVGEAPNILDHLQSEGTPADPALREPAPSAPAPELKEVE